MSSYNLRPSSFTGPKQTCLRLPYSGALQLVRVAARMAFSENPPKVWARNSFALGTLVPFVSDLDLSVLFKKHPSEEDSQTFTEYLSILKKGFPLLGEINVYVRSDSALISELINPFELLRDPGLGVILYSSDTVPIFDGPSAAAFLLRMLESDLHNLRTRPHARTRKWVSHFAAVSENLPPGLGTGAWNPEKPIECILKKVIDLAGVSNPACCIDALEWLLIYFELRAAKYPNYKMSVFLSARPWGQALLPHRFNYLERLFPLLDPQLVRVCMAQLRWELFGMMTQAPLEPEKEKLKEHLDSIGAFIARTAALGPREHFQPLVRLVDLVKARIH